MTNESGPNAVVDLEELTALYLLEGVRGFGPQKFKLLWEEQIRPTDLLSDPALLPIEGKRADQLTAQIKSISGSDREKIHLRARRQIDAANKHQGRILTYASSFYPKNVFKSNNPVPVLYVRGNAQVLNSPAIACVGSRKIRAPYDRLQSDFARLATRERFAIVSGFALGADTLAHKAALQENGETICVMAGGLDRPFPPENRPLWDRFLKHSGVVFVTEFGFGMKVASLTLRKRNKLIVAFARGVMIGQSAAKGGAMNAYRFAVEQKKPVATFRSDGREDSSGNQHIEEEFRPGDQIFDLTSPRLQESLGWLRQLSSSM